MHQNPGQAEVHRNLIRDVEVLDLKKDYTNGMSIADLALKTGYSEKTVRKWLRSDELPKYTRRAHRPGKLDPYKDYIMQRMSEGVFNCELLYREIHEKGYPGGKSILKGFVAPFRRQFKVQAVRRFETKSGEQMQADWGYLGTFDLDGKPRKVWVFVIVLGYSRYLAAHCTTSMDLESLLLSHQHVFNSVGGVCNQIVYDNMKTVTVGRDGAHRPVWQSRFLDFALHYGFQPVAHTPYRPRSKGKVEAAIKYIKQNFCQGRDFTDLTDLNNQLQYWLDAVANKRVHGTTGNRPCDQFLAEELLSLPQYSFQTNVRHPRRVSRDGFFSYQGVLYSVPWPYAGSDVAIEETSSCFIRVFWHEQQIAEHGMPCDGRRRVIDAAHQAGLPDAQRQQQAGGLRQVYPAVQQRALSVYEAFAEVAQ